jgi:hypothetical protein
MLLTNVPKNKAQLKPSVSRASRLLPCALSLVLATQCASLNMLQYASAAWAAEDMSEAAAPSWNEVHSESSKIIEAAGKSTAPGASPSAPAAPVQASPVQASPAAAAPVAVAPGAAAAEPAGKTDSNVPETAEHATADGKSIAEATHVGSAATSTAADAAILTPAQAEIKKTEDAVKSSESDAPPMVTDTDASAAPKSETTQASVKGEATISGAATTTGVATAAGAATIDSALTTPTAAASDLVAPASINSALINTAAAGAPAEGAVKAAPQVGTAGALGTADSLSNEMLRALGGTVKTDEAAAETDGTVMEGGVMVVDCDEKAQVQQEIKYENLETDEAKTHIKAGAVFPVVVSSQISSKTAKKGDAIEARLKYDLKIGDRLIAHKGAEVHGHINYALHARSAMRSLVSPERWYRNSGVLGVEFDEIINEKGEHLPLIACPARTSRIIKNKNEGRVLGVNHLGQITGPWSQQLRYKAIRIGLNAAMAPAGVFSFGAMPVALGLLGAANPSFAFMKPVGNNVRHRRLKGFAWGFLSGVPGSWIIEDTVTKGQESIIKPGDEFLAEFRQEFNGEPASEAQLMPNASVKVHGHVSGKSSDKSSEKSK